ncbi:MAG: zinc-ribbon domain-containing protein [Oscillospiraceae bacterium]|jgi:hypothetical protein|nr:zinc-ribbon domain-containing protein [Oscillospiraceae bacterium]
MAKFCPSCGTKTQEASKFCPFCGQPLPQAQTITQAGAPQQPVKPAQSVQPQPQQYRQQWIPQQPVQQWQSTPMHAAAKRKKSRMPFFAGGAALLAVLLVLAGVLMKGFGLFDNTNKNHLPDDNAAALANIIGWLDRVHEEFGSEESVVYAPEPVIYEPYVFDASKVILSSQHLKYYDLDDKQKELYDRLYTGIANLEMRIEIDPYWNATGANGAFTTVYEILGNNDSEFFWHPGLLSRGTDNTGAYVVLFRYPINGKVLKAEWNDNHEVIYPSEEEIANAKTWIENGRAAIWDVIENLPIHAGMTPFELEVAVHDWLYGNVEFDRAAPNKDNIYGTLVEGRATCRGYTASFQYIMRLVEIECVTYYGYLYEDFNVGHVWNAVKLDDEWYQVDVTSDATGGKKIDEPCFHKYFNRVDEIMARSHTITEEKLTHNPRIVCSAIEYDYYRKTGAYIASDDDFIGKVPVIITKAREEGMPTFEMEFAPDWAAAAEISDKKKLIVKEHWSDIAFSYLVGGTIVFGWFD